MKKIITILAMAVMGTAYGQADTDIVHIPDANFKRVLVNNDWINTNEDIEITYAEARAYRGKIDVRNLNISSLKGIEAFINIRELDCSINHNLKEIDVSKNTMLRILYISSCYIQSIDLSNNTYLKELICDNNKLTNLNISKNVALTYVDCSDNNITTLDTSNNIELEKLYCYNNKIESLDITKNKKISLLSCYGNELTQLNLANGSNTILNIMRAYRNKKLSCIQIDKNFTPKSEDWYGDNGIYSYGWRKDRGGTVYDDNCNYPSLSTTEVKAENHLQILNPVKDNLIIKTTAKVEKIEIYNTAGQLVKVLFKGNTQVQDLAKGVYLIKITTDKGVITEKIIKQ